MMKRDFPSHIFFCALILQLTTGVVVGSISNSRISILLGGTLIMFGIWLMRVCLILFQEKNTPLDPNLDPKCLVVSGPYRFSRNPFYLGSAVIMFGIAIIMQQLASTVVAVLYFGLIDQYVRKIEEISLNRIFLNEYEAYKDKVRRWL